MIKDIVDSVKELDLSEHKPEVLTALLTGTTVASFMYISNARSVQKTAMNITKGVIQESEDPRIQGSSPIEDVGTNSFSFVSKE